MTQPEDRELAEGFALGLLTGDAYRQAAERTTIDDAFAAEVASTEATLAPLALRLAPVAPSDALLGRIEVALGFAGAQARVTRAGAGEWVEASKGVRIKILHEIPSLRRRTYLLELDAGAVATPHLHEQDEECYVLSGDISFGDIRLGVGDYHLAPRGGVHGAVSSQAGCVCLIVAAMD